VEWASSTRQTDIVNNAAVNWTGEEGELSEVHTAMRRCLNSSQKQAIIKHCFSK
jgi:hypothetical protein